MCLGKSPLYSGPVGASSCGELMLPFERQRIPTSTISGWLTTESFTCGGVHWVHLGTPLDTRIYHYLNACAVWVVGSWVLGMLRYKIFAPEWFEKAATGITESKTAPYDQPFFLATDAQYVRFVAYSSRANNVWKKCITQPSFTHSRPCPSSITPGLTSRAKAARLDDIFAARLDCVRCQVLRCCWPCSASWVGAASTATCHPPSPRWHAWPRS